MPISSQFVFATCRAGSEAFLKQEIQQKHGDLLRPAFMRPELITWKSTKPLDENFILGSSFARVEGLSLGPAKTIPDIVAAVALAFGEQKFHVHVFPRLTPSEKEGMEKTWSSIELYAKNLLEAFEGKAFPHAPEAKLHGGDLVLDIVLDEDLQTPVLVGFHRHSPLRHPFPGAFSKEPTPEDAPSRSYDKMAQTLAWLGLNHEDSLKHSVCVELASGPGGASYALIEKSANLYAVDAGRVSSVVSDLAKAKGLKFFHIRKTVGEITDKDIPTNIDILACDMNLAPPVMVHHLNRLLQFLNPRLLVLTLRLNDEKMVHDLPLFLKRIKKHRLGPVRTMQLPANRQELTVVVGKF